MIIDISWDGKWGNDDGWDDVWATHIIYTKYLKREGNEYGTLLHDDSTVVPLGVNNTTKEETIILGGRK